PLRAPRAFRADLPAHQRAGRGRQSRPVRPVLAELAAPGGRIDTLMPPVRTIRPPSSPLYYSSERMFVLGIDPGLSRCGYGAVRRRPLTGGLEAVAAGVLRTPAHDPLPDRLAALAADLRQLLVELRPDAVVVER